MSQVKLTLRQPPNVEFVHGYPGIPSGGTDRPQAAVKGAVEVRVGNPQGVKAKWLRVELRKVETIPGSGGNVFYDYVGPSPVDVWRAHEEWDIVKTGDLIFEIRIPESIPPTLSLEGNVGIRYELIASICTKGKRGFLRKRKSNVVSAQTEIIIDKHDLHSTWPVYCQSDVRQVDLDGVVLNVERHHTCYAPGDRVTVFAAVRSEFQTVILRGFEISLRESRTFRAGAYAQGKKTIPQTRVGNLTENKIPVNVTLMGGMIHKAELQLGIPPNHTTTTLNSARHIDITYVLCVRAIMGTGQPVVMELPVIMSNWPRNVSQEAIRRIGPAPGLSLLAPSNAMHSVEPSRPPPNTFNGRPSQHEIVRPSANTFSPVSPTQSPFSNGSSRPIDEFGVVGSRPTTRSSVDESGNSRRLTITNAQPMEIPNLPDAQGSRRRPSANATTPNGFIDEKKAYERAKATAERVQGNSPPPSRDGSGSAPVKKWMSAEEEKIKLYNSATARVNRTQGQASDSVSNPETPPPSRGPSAKANGYMSAVDEKAALRRYQEAKNAVEFTQSVGFTNGVRDPPPFEAASGSSSSGYESAAAEKARLKRELAAKSSSGSLSYESAAAEKARLKRELVERERRVSPNNDPPPFEANPSSSSGMNGHANGPLAYESAAAEKARLRREMAERERTVSGPPSVASNGNSFESAAAEKARLRREMEERDRRVPVASELPPPFVGRRGSSSPPPFAGSSSPPQFGSSSPPPFVSSSSPPPFSAGSSSSSSSTVGLSEKEILARHFAAQDAEASGSHSRPVSRPTPTPPRAGTSMSAAEEKKMLAARYAGEGSSQSSAFPTPPPLMPRPPAEYIQETQAEDARVSKFVMHDDIPLENGSVLAPPPLPPKPLGG